MTPNGDLWQASWDRYARKVFWTQLAPLGHNSDDLPDSRSVLVCRTVDGERLPVVSLADGELFAVRTVA